MNSRLEQLVEFFSNLNHSDLPAEQAHRLMAPANRRLDYETLSQGKQAKSGAVLVMLYPFRDKIHSVLIQRPNYQGHHSNQISFPGGKMETHDNTLQDTAIREANEEVGVGLDDINVISPLSMLYIPVSNFKVHPYLSYLEQRPRFVLETREVTEVVEFDIDILSEESIKGVTSVKANAQYNIKAPYYDINGKVVWGATAMILSELNEIIKRF